MGDLTFRVLVRRPAFGRIVLACLVSDVGDWLYNVGLVAFVWHRTHDVWWLAVVETLALGARAVCAWPGGLLVDRLPTHIGLAAGAVVRGGMMAALAVLAATGASLAAVCAVVVLTAAAGAAWAPGITAVTPELVPPAALGRANALISATEHAALVVGPVLGAVALAVGPPAMAFALNGASFLAAGALVAAAGRGGSATPAADRITPPRPRPLDGLRAARAGGLTPLFWVWSAAGLLFGLEAVLLPVAATSLLGMGVQGYGWLMASAGIGGLLAVRAGARAGNAGTTRHLVAGLLMIALPFVALATLDNAALGCMVWAFGGAGTALLSVLHDSLLQRRSPQEVIGSAAGAFELVAVVAVVAGSLTAPLLVGALGLRFALAACGLAVSAAALAALPWMRGLDRGTAAVRAATS